MMQKVSSLVSKEIGNYLTNRSSWNIFYNAKSEGLAGDGTTDEYADLSTLINTTINGAEATIIFSPGTYKISTNITIPSNVNLFMTKGAMLSPDSGKTITINGPVEAGMWQIFTGPGTISGSMKVEAAFPQWWGAKIDGSTDDKQAYQNAIAYCIANNKDLSSATGNAFVSDTIYLPRNSTFENQITLDFKGQEFDVPDGKTLFESGELINGTWVSSMGSALDTKNSFGITLKGFVINGGRYGIRLESWNTGCTVQNISAKNCETVIEAHNCYYAKFDNIKTIGSDAIPYVGTRFIFSGQCNLMSFSRLVAANSAIGYLFSGSLTGVRFTSVSVEGCTVGVKFTSAVYDLKVSDCYVENITTGSWAFEFTDYVYNAVFTNNYFNFLSTGWYAIKHASLPLTNIIVEKNNRFEQIISNSYIFQNKGYGYVTLEESSGSVTGLSALDVASGILPTASIYERKLFFGGSGGGPIANVINGYIVGNYSGKMTDGYTNSNLYGMTVTSNTNGQVVLQTRIKYNDRQLLFVSFDCFVYGGTFRASGVFFGNVFYEFEATGINVTTNLTLDTSGSYLVVKTKTGLPNNGDPSYVHATRGGESRVL